MKAGIISWIADLNETKTGVDSYTYNLIKNMINMGKSKDLYLLHYQREGRSSDWIYDKSHEVKTLYNQPIIKEGFSIPHMVKNSEVDILHLPEHHNDFIMPFFMNKAPKILTVHDLTPLFLSETHSTKYRLWWRWKVTLKLIKNRIDTIIAVSESTKNDCIKYLKIPEERIKVVYNAVDESFKTFDDKEGIKEELNRKYGINYPFILFVGTLEGRKNVPTLIKAFYKVKQKGIDHKLVLIGLKGWKSDPIFDTIKSLNLEKEVIFTGYIPEDDLVKFYNAASVFVYPSLYEGFGLPVLEAMSCSCPVVTSNNSSLPEVVGNAGITVNPRDIDNLAESIYNIITDEDLNKKLSKMGLERSKLFSWQKAAAETWQIYEEVYNKNK